MTALMRFAEANRVQMVKLLLAVPTIDVNAKNSYNRSALYFAVQSINVHEGYVEISELLLSHGAVVDNSHDLLQYFNNFHRLYGYPFTSTVIIPFLRLLLAHQSSAHQYYETMILPLVSFGQRYHHLQSQVADMMRELNWQTRKHFLSFLDINSKTSTLNEQQGVGLVTLVVADMLSKMNRIIVEYI